MSIPRIKDDDLILNLKTPAQLKEEFDRLDGAEKNTLLKCYENLGIEVIKSQAKTYKSLYQAYKRSKRKEDKEGLLYSMVAIERWFECNLNKWCVTELNGEELCKKMRNEVDSKTVKPKKKQR